MDAPTVTPHDDWPVTSGAWADGTAEQTIAFNAIEGAPCRHHTECVSPGAAASPRVPSIAVRRGAPDGGDAAHGLGHDRLLVRVGPPAREGRLTAPIVFVSVGWVLAMVLGMSALEGHHELVKLVAEVTLVWVLFADASKVRLSQFRRDLPIYTRLLGVGLPLTVALGAWVAVVLLDFDIWAAVLLAAALAPTDAALGASVMSNPTVPERIRRALNVESGLNDGIATPMCSSRSPVWPRRRASPAWTARVERSSGSWLVSWWGRRRRARGLRHAHSPSTRLALRGPGGSRGARPRAAGVLGRVGGGWKRVCRGVRRGVVLGEPRAVAGHRKLRSLSSPGPWPRWSAGSPSGRLRCPSSATG